jgi:hypothetical protein
MSFADLNNKKIRFSEPYLPEVMNVLTLTGLQVGDSTVDLQVRRIAKQLTVEVLDGTGDVYIEVDH